MLESEFDNMFAAKAVLASLMFIVLGIIIPRQRLDFHAKAQHTLSLRIRKKKNYELAQR